MASGRLPGDFWPRHPGFRPPGAESPSENDGNGNDDPADDSLGDAMDDQENEAFMEFLTQPSDDDDKGAPMKRPSALRNPIAKKPAASVPAGASKVPKVKAKAKGKAKSKAKTTKETTKAKAKAKAKPDETTTATTNAKPRDKLKPKAKAKSNSKGKSKGKSEGKAETAEVEMIDGEPVRRLGADGIPEDVAEDVAAPDVDDDGPPPTVGCSKCRWKGCSKCR
eukprot:s3238_g6.t1